MSKYLKFKIDDRLIIIKKYYNIPKRTEYRFNGSNFEPIGDYRFFDSMFVWKRTDLFMWKDEYQRLKNV